MPTKINGNLIRAFCNRARKGMPARAICWELGITEQAYYNWLRKASMGIEPFLEFSLKVRAAQAEFITESIEAIKEGDSNRKWLLTKLYPSMFGNRSTVEYVREPETKALQADVIDVSLLTQEIDARKALNATGNSEHQKEHPDVSGEDTEKEPSEEPETPPVG